jgi:hypothetical protein
MTTARAASKRLRWLTFGLLGWPLLVAADCPPTGWDMQVLSQLREANFEGLTPQRRAALAAGLLDCLAAPDPQLRDGVAYSGLSSWLRGGLIEPALRAELTDRVLALLQGSEDELGFSRSFAALVLSELVRADRIDPQLPGPKLAQIRQTASDWYRQIADYRAFDPVEGWRHAVAHGADLILQLAVHPATDADALAELMQALASQIAPAGAYGYRHSESERQARAVYFAYQRDLLASAWWSNWLQELSANRPDNPWSAAFDSAEGLARRHNMLGFLHEIGFAARLNEGERNAELARWADEASRKIRGG